MVSTNGYLLSTDEGIKMESPNDEVLGITLVDYDRIIFGLVEVIELGFSDGTCYGSNHSKLEGNLLG